MKEFAWLSPARRDLHATARDNADFAAQGCVVLTAPGADMSEVVSTLRATWSDVLDASTGRGTRSEALRAAPAAAPAAPLDPTTMMEAAR